MQFQPMRNKNKLFFCYHHHHDDDGDDNWSVDVCFKLFLWIKDFNFQLLENFSSNNQIEMEIQMSIIFAIDMIIDWEEFIEIE